MTLPVSTASTKAPAADYRYIITDTLTDSVVAELPFVDVSFENRLNEAGQFQGSFPITEGSSVLDIYNSTLPGKNSIYVLRDGECVWGGIISSRSYNIKEKILDISADEFVSYLDRRAVWKTWSTEFPCDILIFNADQEMPDEPDAPRMGQVTIIGDIEFTEFNIVPGSRFRLWFGSKTESDAEKNKQYYDGYYTVTDDPNFPVDAENKTFYFSPFYRPEGQKNFRPIALGNYSSEIGCSVKLRQQTDDYLTTLLNAHFADDLLDLGFAKRDNIPGRLQMLEIESFSRTNNIVTVKTVADNFFVPGQIIAIKDLPGFRTNRTKVISVIDSKTFTYAFTGADVPQTLASNVNLVTQIARFQRVLDTATFYTEDPHGLAVGDIVRLSGVDSQIDSKDLHEVTRIGTSAGFNDSIFQIESRGRKINISNAAPSAAATRIAVVESTTAGSYINNSDIGITFERDPLLSTTMVEQEPILGSELFTFKEIIDKYSNDLIGFDYRIDCTFDREDNTFSKAFKFLPLVPVTLQNYVSGPGGTLPENKLVDLQYFSVEGKNANSVAFEFPGNIETVNFTESLEEGATRVFAQGQKSTGAFSAYGAATDYSALTDGWPLFDKIIKKDKLNYREDLYKISKNVVAQAQLPVATFSITVNGSLDPQVGSYKPGDWCIVRIDDPFISQRLGSYYENKGDSDRRVFLRKISSVAVQLSANPTLPEIVTLQLVTEPGVDITGAERAWRDDA
ncbi:MAG: hypothetical protein EBS38_01400 [Actinobacteria bacterium]|nr:hypothetical protein [Actinomycetota bacterium]